MIMIYIKNKISRVIFSKIKNLSGHSRSTSLSLGKQNQATPPPSQITNFFQQHPILYFPFFFFLPLLFSHYDKSLRINQWLSNICYKLQRHIVSFLSYSLMENNPISSSRTDRKTIERNRRNQMKALCSKLNSLLPHQSSRVPIFLSLSFFSFSFFFFLI